MYMLHTILNNLDRYPLDGVVHFELEIDYPFIKNVIDYMESECTKIGVKFFRIKPRKTWEELYYTVSKTGKMRGFPTRVARWCNNIYKLDSKKQLEDFLKSERHHSVFYIGYCADEEKRFTKRESTEVYPLVENGITENEVLEWSKAQPLFNHYYETQKRCGCMYCPLASYLNFAYLLKYYPSNFEYMIARMKETEKIRELELGRPFSVISSNPKYNAEYIDKIVKVKWLKKLEEKEEKLRKENSDERLPTEE